MDKIKNHLTQNNLSKSTIHYFEGTQSICIEVLWTCRFLYPFLKVKKGSIYLFLVSSNNPKKVQAINEISPVIKEIIAKINFPKKRIAIAVVIKTKEKIK